MGWNQDRTDPVWDFFPLLLLTKVENSTQAFRRLRNYHGFIAAYSIIFGGIFLVSGLGRSPISLKLIAISAILFLSLTISAISAVKLSRDRECRAVTIRALIASLLLHCLAAVIIYFQEPTELQASLIGGLNVRSSLIGAVALLLLSFRFVRECEKHCP